MADKKMIKLYNKKHEHTMLTQKEKRMKEIIFEKWKKQLYKHLCKVIPILTKSGLNKDEAINYFCELLDGFEVWIKGVEYYIKIKEKETC